MSTIFVPGADAFVTHCGAILKGEWSEWTFADLGMVPLCEECKAKVHAP